MAIMPMREVPRAQADRCWMGRGYTATDDSGQMVRLVLLEMAPKIPHALRQLKIPAFPTFDLGFDLRAMGSGRMGSGGEHVIRGARPYEEDGSTRTKPTG